MLSYVYSLPLLVTSTYVAIGNVIASVLIGWPVFKLQRKLCVQKWIKLDAMERPSLIELGKGVQVVGKYETDRKVRDCS
jgi:hypothetical protein